MKNFLVLLLLCSAFSSLYALPDPPTKTYSRQDTALAVRNLFANKRSAGKTLTMVGSCFVAGGLVGLPAGAPVLVVGLVPMGIGLVKQTRFRRHRENVLLTTYQTGGALPNRIQRRLTARYFDQPDLVGMAPKSDRRMNPFVPALAITWPVCTDANER